MEFSDVNVGDKVRLTSKLVGTTRFEFVVTRVGPGLSVGAPGVGPYHAAYWSVEVLEHAPKPLPDVSGLYVSMGRDERDLYELDAPFNWWHDIHGSWTSIPIEEVPTDLVRLVPFSDVEAARKATVSEIVAHMYGCEWNHAAREIESKFGGGKA